MVWVRVILVVVFLTLLASCSMAAPAYVWREAETADEASFAITAKAGSAEFSGGQWIQEGIPDGGSLKYKLDITQPGAYHIWLRIGFEYVRATIQWRIDSGEWKTITPRDLTTNVTFIYYWTELGWLHAGEASLGAGNHTLEVKFGPKTGDNFIAAFDCLCLVQGNWVPDGTLKPGEEPNSDVDIKASQAVYKFENKSSATGKRQTLPLNGLWQITRFDQPDMNTDKYEPIRNLPTQPHWRGINVPGDYQTQLGALGFAHCVWYKCNVDIPASMNGRSFILDFTGTSWITSVIVNGKFMGWSKLTRVPWQCDITSGIIPGKTNEIWVGVKDIYYSIDKENLNESRNIPMETLTKWPPRFVTTVYPTSKGDADGLKCGITDPVQLIVTDGSVYVSDVFVKTSVTDDKFKPTNKVITTEVTLTNPTEKEMSVKVDADISSSGSNKVEKSLPAVTASVPAHGTKTVILTSPWPEAKLWWPQEDPAMMYDLNAQVQVDEKAIDVYTQPFGFREVKIDGKYVRINGLRRNFWNLLSGFQGDTDAQKLAHFYEGNNRFERFSADIGGQIGITNRSEQLDWADKHGIAGRLSTMIDGMFITYTLENPVVWENFKEHVEQVIKNNRNHPSVIVYSLENELLMINGVNIHGPKEMDTIEALAYQNLITPAQQMDPTRPTMLDGAGALKDQSLDICNTHYSEDGFHPDNAYPINQILSQTRWTWDMNRPYCAGEIAYFAGNNSDHAWIGGEMAMTGKIGALKSYSKYLKYLFERYRWNDVSMTCPWVGQADTQECWSAMSDLAVFTREYNVSFFSGQTVTRTVKVFNDTFSTAPVTFKWTVNTNGKSIASGTKVLNIEPGFNQQLTISFNAPKVTSRLDGQLVLEVTQPGAKKPYKEIKKVVFFPHVRGISLKRNVYTLGTSPLLSKTLGAMGIKAAVIASVKNAKSGGTIIVGQNAFAKIQSPANLLSYARSGGRVIILEQDTPVPGGSLETTLNIGSNLDKKPYPADFAFGQQGTPLLYGLDNATLSNWAGDAPTSKTVWEKTTGAARSWITCGPALNGSTLIELPCGIGEIIATQMRVEEKLAIEPAAELLLANMINRADTYSPPTKTVAVFSPDSSELSKFVTDLKCQQKTLKSIDEGLNIKTTPVMIINASNTNLASLNSKKAQVDAYTKAGGYIILCGLQPDGLAAYNRLLGTQHILREFRRESVLVVSDPLSVGLSPSDVAQFTDEVIAAWTGQRNVSKDVFTYCVDGEDIAPFCFGSPNIDYPENHGNGAYNLVNNLFNADMWWYIDQIGYDPGKKENELVTFKLPVPCKLKTVTIWNNKNYDTVKDCSIRVDNKTAAAVELPDSYDPVEVALNGLQAKSTLSLYSQSIRKHGDSKLVGLDEVKIIRELPEWYQGKAFPLVNCGGIVRYPRGKGGFVLNQLKLTGTDLPENATKKQRITASILQNLGIAFKTDQSGSGQSPKDPGKTNLPNYIPPIGQENMKK